MKRFLALAALVLGLASCQTEPEGLNVNVGGEVDTTVCVSLPEATRANSALGAFDNVDLTGNLTIRYIFEVYYGEGANQKAVQKQVYYTDEKTASFPVRLVPGRDYNFVAWADIVEESANIETNKALPYEDSNVVENHYDAEFLNAITFIGEWNAMDETRDAYSGFHNTNGGEKYTGSSSINIRMTRPFAKLRVITTDMNELNALGIRPVSAKVTYSAFSHESFNALSGTYSDNTIIEEHIYEIANYADQTGANKVLFTDYFFADDNDVVKFELDVYEADVDNQTTTTLIKHNDFKTDIPVQRNYLTTIQGNVLTDGNNVKVTVEDDGAFAGENVEKIVEVGNATDLQEAINNSTEETTIVLGGDIVLGDGIITLAATRADNQYAIVIPTGKTVSLDLNGKTLSLTKAQTGKYALIENNGTLTICNSAATNGTISYGDTAQLTADVGYASNTIQNNGTLTINEGVTLLNTSGSGVAQYGYPHVIDTNGTLTIKGGTLTNEANYSTMRIWTSNTDAEKCNVTINGGTFNGCIDFQAHNNNYATMPHYGTLTVNGGTFNADNFTNSAIRVLRFAVNANDMHATINGGTFNGKVWVRNIGTFESTPKIFDIYNGTFTIMYDGFDTLLAKGHIFKALENGNYTVAELKLNANFADNDWSDIVLACENNCVPESWNVGDKKAMTIGKYTYDIAIIGKNHDVYSDGSGKAPLTLQLFQLYGTDAQMNETQDNTTGWSGSKMRNTTMEEIRSVMPDEVKNAIKAVDKVSLNGSKNALETTSDKLFLLSEKEVNGSEYYSGGYVEGARYAYYADQKWDSNGNLSSQIMKPSPNKDNKWTVSWYLRTPKNDKVDNTRFIAINGSGIMTHITAEIKSGLVFGFCF